MSYRESRKFCKACGRVTVHWRPWTSWHGGDPRDPSHWPLRVLHGLANLIRGYAWRCLECDHPWHASLLGRQGGKPLRHAPRASDVDPS